MQEVAESAQEAPAKDPESSEEDMEEKDMSRSLPLSIHQNQLGNRQRGVIDNGVVTDRRMERICLISRHSSEPLPCRMSYLTKPWRS